jgi:type I restriction enzyme S subunit
VIASNGQVGTHDKAAIPAPAVVTGRSGTIGKVNYFNGPCWPLNTTLFVRDFKGSDPRFVFHFLSAFPLMDYQSGTGVPTLNRNDVHVVEVAWPELEEQRAIASTLDSLEQSVTTISAGLDYLRGLKVHLNGDLLSGRVRVPA